MSIIETINDVNNSFLSRREITCKFAGLGGKLKKLQAIDMITKEFKLDGKIVIPINLQTHVGKPLVTGTFYIYEDEKLATAQVSPVIFSRLEKARSPDKDKEGEKKKEKPSEPKSEEAKPAKGKEAEPEKDEKAPEKSEKPDDKPANEVKTEEKPMDKKKETEAKTE